MGTFIQKPPTVQARQFTGGENSATDIGNFLSTAGAIVSLDSARDELIVRVPSTDGTSIFVMAVGDWVIINDQWQMQAMNDEQFQASFMPVEEPASGE